MARSPDHRAVGCLCEAGTVVVLVRRPTRGPLAFYGGVCDRCGRGIDLRIEKTPANEVKT